ncbi:hypothetical protein C4559_03320 [Candidatus Microgenomates bacterium]|nr:MAG: hypothetical protein C4559_03320 [Candidatus Microgenomates bacterium]
MKKVYLALFFIILLASVLRLWNLGDMPSGITNDEAGYIYSSYSILKTGEDLVGNFMPFSFNLDNSFSPIPVYLIIPFLSFFGISPFSGRLVFALAGIGSVILVFLIAKNQFNSKIAFFSSLMMSVSAWHLQVSRIAYDGGIALFFYLFGIYIFLKNIKNENTKKVLLSLPFFLLAFYSYHATKIYFLALTAVLVIVFKKELLKRKKVFFLFLFGVITIFFSFLYISMTQDVTRSSVFLFKDDKPSKMVNWEREKNTAPPLLKTIFSNKPLYFLRAIRENYLEAFSPQFLFLYGETSGLSSIYGVSFRGVMYIIELPLLIFGLIYLLNNKNKKIRNLIVLLLLISPFPSALTKDRSYVMRSIMMMPFLLITASLGLHYLLTLIGRLSKPLKIISITSIIIIYSFLISEYLYQYYFRYSVYSAEAWFGSERDLFYYLDKNKNEYKKVYIAEVEDMFVLQYAVFNRINPKLMQEIWSKNWPKKIGDVNFINGCFDSGEIKYNPNFSLPDKTLYVVPDKCHKDFSPLIRINDRGEPLRTIWKIYQRTI